MVIFSEVKGMEGLNDGVARKIKNCKVRQTRGNEGFARCSVAAYSRGVPDAFGRKEERGVMLGPGPFFCRSQPRALETLATSLLRRRNLQRPLRNTSLR